MRGNRWLMILAMLAGFLAGGVFVAGVCICVLVSTFEDFEGGIESVSEFDDTAEYARLPWTLDGEDWPKLGEGGTSRCAGTLQPGHGEEESAWDRALAECLARELHLGMSMRELLELRPPIPSGSYEIRDRQDEAGERFVGFGRHVGEWGMSIEESYGIAENRLVGAGLRFHTPDVSKLQDSFRGLAATLEEKLGAAPQRRIAYSEVFMMAPEPHPQLVWRVRGTQVLLTYWLQYRPNELKKHSWPDWMSLRLQKRERFRWWRRPREDYEHDETHVAPVFARIGM